MQVFVVLVLELFVKTTAKLAYVLGVCYGFWGWHLYELVLGLFELLAFVLYGDFLGLPWLLACMDWTLILIAIVFASTLMEFLLNRLNNLRAKSLQKWLHTGIANFTRNTTDELNGRISDITVLIISILYSILDDSIVIFAQLEALH